MSSNGLRRFHSHISCFPALIKITILQKLIMKPWLLILISWSKSLILYNPQYDWSNLLNLLPWSSCRHPTSRKQVLALKVQKKLMKTQSKMTSPWFWTWYVCMWNWEFPLREWHYHDFECMPSHNTGLTVHLRTGDMQVMKSLRLIIDTVVLHASSLWIVNAVVNKSATCINKVVVFNDLVWRVFKCLSFFQRIISFVFFLRRRC